MTEVLIFDFYGVIYSNFDWSVIDARIYSSDDKTREFVALKRRANKGDISNEEFLLETGRLAEDEKFPDKPAVKRGPSVNYAALGLIESLRSKYKIGLLSNGTHEHINSVFKALGGAEKFFDLVITSSDTKHIKPDRKAFIGIAKKLGSRPQTTVVIDDSAGHIEGAREAGFKTIKFDEMKQLRQDLENLEIC